MFADVTFFALFISERCSITKWESFFLLSLFLYFYCDGRHLYSCCFVFSFICTCFVRRKLTEIFCRSFVYVKFPCYFLGVYDLSLCDCFRHLFSVNVDRSKSRFTGWTHWNLQTADPSGLSTNLMSQTNRHPVDFLLVYTLYFYLNVWLDTQNVH